MPVKQMYFLIGIRLFVIVITLSGLSSCKLFFPNYLFRENKDIVSFNMDSLTKTAQTIMPGDLVSFRLTTRKGYELVDLVTANAGGQQGQLMQGLQAGIRYLVRTDGTVEFPLIGNINVLGMTRLDLENLLESKYSSLYNDPFILLQVTNRRVFVFMGLGGASVISLPTENTTLIEVIALAGGIPPGAKSHKIRVIRGDLDAPSIKKVDFSTIDGLRDADFIIQPFDMIVVEPTTKVAPAILGDLTPVLTLLTTVLTFYLLIRR